MLGFLGLVRQVLQGLTFTRLLCYVRCLLDEDCCNCNVVGGCGITKIQVSLSVFCTVNVRGYIGVALLRILWVHRQVMLDEVNRMLTSHDPFRRMLMPRQRRFGPILKFQFLTLQRVQNIPWSQACSNCERDLWQWHCLTAHYNHALLTVTAM